ncbi:protein phosphatase 1M-like [Scyliorhinus canicula]|uniref:protein phosphatase 1M-like n=1 Tax=Scyliorhinus canicula TaxID=7830 RepID=UPI0018F5F77C|nr:protein phosphatase 1M-like [Scyliorhinus canicula]
MFKRLKRRTASLSSSRPSPSSPRPEPTPTHRLYSRPHFLHQSPAETSQNGDERARPVLLPPKNKKLPWNTGYAEVINAGKSILNEDQATCRPILLRKAMDIEEEWVLLCPNEDTQDQGLAATYWGLFDGHNGPMAAVLTSEQLHHCIREQLEEILDVISGPCNVPPPLHLAGHKGTQTEISYGVEKNICVENLVKGALETAFKNCDELIEHYQASHNQAGGCTVLVILRLLGKLYVANAGDSRAIIVRKTEVLPLSNEFTAVTERQRIQHLAFLKPELLGDAFSRQEFPRRVKRNDIGKKILYRDYFMSGWGYKMAQEDDLKYPVVHGDGRQTRVMGTIAVTRGLGDHGLMVYDTDLQVKPFLSCIPEVTVFDLGQQEFGQSDVIVMATDGLWDVMSNKEVADTSQRFLEDQNHNPRRYTMLAQCLVNKARGTLQDGDWKLEDGSFASFDDISVFVIPLLNIADSV